MKKNILVCTLAVFVAVGCAHDKYGPRGGSDPARPKVDVVKDLITVSPEILVFGPEARRDVVWSLPAESKLTFPDDGIVIEGRLVDELVKGAEKVSVVLDTKQTEIVNCRVVPETSRKQYTCQNRYTMTGVYKYTIRVQDEQKKTFHLDPNWVNTPAK